ncbi:XRE family transcriptional regulator [Nocardioides sp. WG-D5]
MTSAAPRTTLEAIKIERGLTWRDVARSVERASATPGGRSVTLSEDHARRLGTRALGEVQPTPAIARALESAFGHPVVVLLGPHDPAATPPAGRPSYQEALTMAAEKARHLALNMPGIDDYSLLEEELRDLARAYPVQALPELINPLVTLQDAVHQAILSPRRPGDAAQLFSIGAVTGGILAKASHDLGDPRAAVTQARTALILAEQAGNTTVAAWLNGLMALVAYWDGRSQESLRYVERGLATNAVNSATLWLESSGARAWARLGNEEEATQSIHRADEIADATEPTDLDELGGILTFTDARAAYYAADALSWIPNHAESVGAAQEAVDAYADETRDTWAFGDAAGARCDQAIIRIANGEVEGAAESIASVLELPRDLRIGGVVKSVQRVGDAVDAASDGKAADELRGQIEAFVARPLTMRP